MLIGPEDRFVEKNIGVQCFKVFLKKPWPNLDSNPRCLKLINMAIMEVECVVVSSWKLINIVSLLVFCFQCIRTILI